jgi:hypothetical protein
LGPKRTRNDLIPFLHGNQIKSRIHKIELLEDDDEVLLALVEQLEKSSFV